MTPLACTLFRIRAPALFSVVLIPLLLATHSYAAPEPIKVGVLHSLSGTMAISETTLKDTMLMLIEQQNAAGGVLGRPLEAVVV
ncbi:MAG: transporter substrate-binding protein, partial [Pseudomonadota bacterium]